MGTANTRTWNAGYEANPPSGQNLNEGADRITEFKKDIRERVEEDHYWDLTGTDADHGEHTKVTLREQASDPTNATNKGFLYTKNDGTATELYFEDEVGNVLQLTNGGVSQLTVSNNRYTGSNVLDESSITYAATITPDLDNGNAQRVTMTGNMTLNPITNAHTGAVFTLRVIQSGNGNTLSFHADIRKAVYLDEANTELTGNQDLYTFYYNGALWALVSVAKQITASI